MTKKETGVLLGYLKIAYPNMMKDTDAELMLNVWHEMLCDEESSLVRLALKKHTAASIYPPSISEFLDLIEKEKWAIYSEYTFSVLSDEDVTKKLPDCYIPRSITHKPKQFEINATSQIEKIIDIGIAKINKKGTDKISSKITPSLS